MKNVLFLTLCLLGMAYTSKAQVGIGTTTPHASAQLQIDATNRGLLAPRLTQTQRDAISSPATGLLIYQTDNTPGFYYYNGSAWQAVSADGLPTLAINGQTLRFDATTNSWVTSFILYNNGNNAGVNTANPQSMFDVQGSMGLRVTTVTSATTLNNIHNVVLCNNGPYTVTLPQASTCTGRVLYIKNIDAGAEPITIDGNGAETIEGYTNLTLNIRNHVVRIISDGSNWHILEESYEVSGYQDGRTCDGAIFTWNDVTNPTTGATWMDRNLGASQAATSITDVNAYGDLYQWGRDKDGHQCRNANTTTTLSSTNTPGHSDFIVPSATPWDWRSPQNDNLWQGVAGINNPCPSGYRIPTQPEWAAEVGSWSPSNATGAFNSLGFTLPGQRSGATIGFAGAGGRYWSSTVSGTNVSTMFINTTSSSSNVILSRGNFGFPVRCIKD